MCKYYVNEEICVYEHHYVNKDVNTFTYVLNCLFNNYVFKQLHTGRPKQSSKEAFHFHCYPFKLLLLAIKIKVEDEHSIIRLDPTEVIRS